MENVRILDPAGRGGGRSVGISDPGGHPTLSGDGGKAAPVSTRDGLSHSVEHPLCTDGDRRGPDLSHAGIQCQKSGAGHFSPPAGSKLLLEHPVFQSGQIRPCPALAFPFVGTGGVDVPVLLAAGSPGSSAADPIPAVDHLRGLP